MDHSLTLAGFAFGLCVGLTSIGGSALMAPFLILIVGVRPVTAVGTDLAYGAITKLVGAAVHWHEDTIDFGLVRTLAIGSVPGAVLAALFIRYLPVNGDVMDAFLRSVIGTFLIVAAALVFVQIAGLSDVKKSSEPLKALQGGGTTAFGAVAGFAVGLSSIGSGSLITPFLMFVYRLPAARVVGTDLFHAAILVTAAAAIHAASGSVDWTLVSALLVGSVPGVLLGSWLAPRLPTPVLRVGLAGVLATSGLKLI